MYCVVVCGGCQWASRGSPVCVFVVYVVCVVCVCVCCGAGGGGG